MKVPHYVERVFVLFKNNPMLKNLVGDSKSSLFVMRVDARKKGIILEPWDNFKSYCEGKFSDVIFRHLYMDR